MISDILNKSRKQHFSKQQLCSHLSLISQSIQIRQTGHTGHSRPSKDKLISSILLWTPTHGQTSVSGPAKTHIHHLCTDTKCLPEDLSSAITYRDKWQESQGNLNCQHALTMMMMMTYIWDRKKLKKIIIVLYDSNVISSILLIRVIMIQRVVQTIELFSYVLISKT